MKKEMKEIRYVITYCQQPSGMFGALTVTYPRVSEAASAIRMMVRAQHRADLIGSHTEQEIADSWEEINRNDEGLWTETIQRRGMCETRLHGIVYLYKIEPVTASREGGRSDG